VHPPPNSAATGASPQVLDILPTDHDEIVGRGGGGSGHERVVESTKGSRMSSSEASVLGAGLPFLSHEMVGLGPVGRLRDDGNDRRN
jgi:hypothetical protein